MNKNKISGRGLIACAAAGLAMAAVIAYLVYAGDSQPLAVDLAVRDWFVSIRGNFLNIINVFHGLMAAAVLAHAQSAVAARHLDVGLT